MKLPESVSPLSHSDLLLLPRQESFASLHILTRRASEGSEALPSLARRVRMSFFGARVIQDQVFLTVANGEMVNSVVTAARELNVSAIRTVEKTVPRIPESISASSTRPAVASRAGGSL